MMCCPLDDTPVTRLYSLTTRELEVFTLLTMGKTNKTIADELDITEKTVEFHLHNLYSKLGVQTRLEAVAWAIQQDVVPKDWGFP